MATTSVLSLPYLAGGDSPNLPANNAALAAAVEGIISDRIQHGVAQVQGTGANFASVTVNFAPAFPASPRVVACYLTTAGGAQTYRATVQTISSTQAVLRIYARNPSETFNDVRRIAWLAIGI